MKFEPKQIFNIVNEASKQALGTSTIKVVDTSTLVSLGKELEKDSRVLDMWFGKIWAKVGDIFIRSQKFEAPTRKVRRALHEFGLYTEKISFGVPDLKKNIEYDGISNTSDPFNATSTIPIDVRVYKSMATYRTKEPIPTTQLMTAFYDEYKMAQFLAGLYMSMENAFILSAKACDDMAVNTNIAVVLNGTNKAQKRNLLDEYNKAHKTADGNYPFTSVEEAKENIDFLRWSGKEILNTISYMGDITTSFNLTDGTATPIPRQTKKENLVVEMLADFAKSYSTYLSANTFHKELVELPNYEEVVKWQGSDAEPSGANKYDFNALSSIAISNSEISASDIEQSGIICFVHDVESCASTCEIRSDYTLYDPDQNRNIVYKRHTTGYAVDPTENAVVFYLEYVAPTPGV